MAEGGDANNTSNDNVTLPGVAPVKSQWVDFKAIKIIFDQSRGKL